MSSIDEVIADLRAAVNHVRQAIAAVWEALDQIGEIRDRCESLGVTDVVRRIEALRERVEMLERHLAGGVDMGEELIVQTEAVKGVGGGSGSGETILPVASTPEPVAERAPAIPGWRRAGETPQHVQVAGTRMRPRAPEDQRFTLGIMDGEAIYSGGEDEHLVWPRSAPPVTYWQHVESKVAAKMRSERRQYAEVTIDNTVCGTNDRDRAYPWTCDKVLPGILPKDSRLVVWVTCDGGRSFWRRAYHGTGERIRP